MTHKRHCKVCGREFHTVRYKNRYCSSNCLKKAKEFKYEVPTEPQDDGTPYLSALMYNKVCPTPVEKSLLPKRRIQSFVRISVQNCTGCMRRNKDLILL